MEIDREPDSSQLFLVRLWADEAGGAGETGESQQVRGKLQHVLSGKAAPFSDWATLRNLLMTMPQSTDSSDGNSNSNGGRGGGESTRRRGVKR